ncbi:uncharacterized protein LOC111693298 [Trichogramma pretiosum]|uniref:uncharacterized protein LOC111693298 n=1 Tax=Trichogramma pretiosum TaxID=7493 RepID=UPI000C71B91F|nr:uncharacterized protein LOC111693298 [Trichogramma pretiosum]
MEHAKKLVLLPKESLDRLGCGSDVVIVKQKKSAQTPGTPLERLDAEMNEILLAPCSDERAKWNRYNNVLQRYLQLKKTSQHIIEKKIKTEERTDEADDASDTGKDEASATSSAPIKSVDAFIVESVPAKYRHNAKNLVEWLRKDGSVKWSENGSIFGFDTEPGKKYLTLGFDSSVTGSRPSDLSAALPKMLLIYTDIIEPIFTGDIQAKLLRCVSIGGEKYRYGFTEISRFSPPMYIPLLYNSFQTIEIDIRDQHGQPIPFDCGTLTAILHFKRMDQ